MDFFVINKNDNKHYLAIPSAGASKYHIYKSWGYRFKILDVEYSVNDITAEPTTSLFTRSILCAFLGMLAGPIGVIIGAAFGYCIGLHEERKEQYKVDAFNNTFFMPKGYTNNQQPTANSQQPIANTE